MTKSRSYERKAPAVLAITPVEYGGLQTAFEHFNRTLFEGALPDVFITYQRRARSGGYFSPDRFSGRIANIGKHELALNPDGFIGHTDEFILSVLVHEQCHVWQHHCAGRPARRGYHDKQWAAKMKTIGLQPSNDGMVGGKETGQQMLHYVVPSGRFQIAYQKLAATGWGLNLQSTPHAGPKGGNSGKTKFSCTSCGQNAWGKPDLAISCIPCGQPMRSAALVDRTNEMAA